MSAKTRARKAAPKARPKARRPAAKPARAPAPAPAGPAGAAARMAALARAHQAVSEDAEEAAPAARPAPPPPSDGVEVRVARDSIDPAAFLAAHKADGGGAPPAAAKVPARPGAPSPPPASPPRGRTVVIDDEPEGPVVAKGGSAPAPAAAGDDVQVVAKQASKFTAADLEMLKSVIVPKGSTAIVNGFNLDAVRFNEEGLVPVTAQDRATGAVVQVGYLNREGLERALRGSRMCWYDRKKNALVDVPDGAGRSQRLVQMRPDCDNDAVLALVDQEGPGCLRDTGTCFHEGRPLPVATALGECDRLLGERVKGKGSSATSKLLRDPPAAAKAVEERAHRLAKAVQGGKGGGIEAEAADLALHALVAARSRGVAVEPVLRELQKRLASLD